MKIFSTKIRLSIVTVIGFSSLRDELPEIQAHRCWKCSGAFEELWNQFNYMVNVSAERRSECGLKRLLGSRVNVRQSSYRSVHLPKRDKRDLLSLDLKFLCASLRIERSATSNSELSF